MSLTEQDADLGLPIKNGVRFRLLRRLMAKAMWPFFGPQARLNHAVIREFNDLGLRLENTEQFVRRHSESLEHHTDVLVRFEAALAKYDAIFSQSDFEATIARHNEILQHHASGLEHHFGVLVRFEETLANHAALFDEVRKTFERSETVGLRRFQEETSFVRRDLAEVLAEVDRQVAAQAEENAIIQRSIAQQQMRIAQLDIFFAAYRRTLDASQLEVTPRTSPEPPAVVDGIYCALEDAFRGSPALVKDRLKVYLDDVQNVSAGGGVVLDLGCGRGEWLELLRDRDVEAYGVDTNVTYKDRWDASGINVVIADAIDHLRSLAPGSVAVVTAFHLVEHLPIEALIELMDLTNRVLQPGGLFIMETPNPENLVVGASTFYLDPTHQRPIPPALLEFLTGARGFYDVKIIRFQRDTISQLPIPRHRDGGIAEELGPLLETINARLFGPEDYAVLARHI